MATLETLSPRKPSLHMSEEEFVRWSRSNESAEWIDGEVVQKSPASEEHDEIQAILRNVVGQLVSGRKLGKVRGPQFTTRLQLKDKVVRRDPDLMFLAASNASRATPTYIDGPPDLAVEIVSPDSDFRDFHQKFTEYDESGVREYWIINPLGQSIYLFLRDAKTGSLVQREADKEGRFWSTVLEGLWFRPDDLFAAERPSALALLRQIDPSLLQD